MSGRPVRAASSASSVSAITSSSASSVSAGTKSTPGYSSDGASSFTSRPRRVKSAVSSVVSSKSGTRPSYLEMIRRAIAALKERHGSSRQAILSYMSKTFSLGSNKTMINTRVRNALKAGVSTGSLRQVKGTGANGIFKLADTVQLTKPNGRKRTVSVKRGVRKTSVKKATKKPAGRGAGKRKSTGGKATPKKGILKNATPKRKARRQSGGKKAVKGRPATPGPKGPRTGGAKMKRTGKRASGGVASRSSTRTNRK